MKKVFLLLGCWLLVAGLSAQTVTQKLQKAFQQFENDSQLKHAISSLYVIDAATGKVVFDKNSQVGLAPASTQKIITAATAFELLGGDYKYKTEFGINKIDDSLSLYIYPSGDPTLGSWRWASTKEDVILDILSKAYTNKNIKLANNITYYQKSWENQLIPDGWIWQDVGNYYGAGAGLLNWRENQFDMVLQSGSKIGDPVKILKTIPPSFSRSFVSLVSSASKGSGDNAYIYPPGMNNIGMVQGTIPVNENDFSISGSIQDPESFFIETIRELLITKGNIYYNKKTSVLSEGSKVEPEIIYTHYSPSLDSIIYWFLKKSVNLYGEALIKTLAYEKNGFGSTDSGVEILKKFWKEKEIDDDELNIYDGSGLSPQNRVTSHAQVEILKYAKKKDWFPYFYNALPEYNGMKMKSGTIRDVKGFCGYHKAKDGKEYIFSFLVNNYNGKTSGVVNKMYKVLDELK